MDFITYMITNMSYHNILKYLLRFFIWGLVGIIKNICDSVEVLFNKIFKMIGFFYSSNVLSYIQEHFMPLIVVLLSVSFIMLGYNLITKSDDSDRKGVIGAFTQNFILFLVIMFFLPLLFSGQSTLSGSKYNLNNVYVEKPNEVKYTSDGSNVPVNGDAKKEHEAGGLLYILKGDKDNDFLSAFSYKNTNSTADSVISEHITDWLWVYNQIDPNTGKYNNMALTTSDSATALQSCKTKHYNMKNIEDLSINDRIYPGEYEADDNNGTSFETIAADKISKLSENKAEGADALARRRSGLTAYSKYFTGKFDNKNKINYNIDTLSFTDYIFGYTHSAIDVDGDLSYSNCDCDNGSFGLDVLGSYPYRYSVDWIPMLIELIAVTLVYFFLCFKTASLIWELAVNHILLYLFAAGDLTSGRKVKEILKSIFSIIATIIFAYIDLQVFLISCNYINSFVNASADSSTLTLTSTEAAFVKIFFAYACIDGPAILEKVFGIDAGLRRPAAALAGAAALGMKALKTGAKAVGKTAKGLTKGAVGIGGYMAGKNEAKRELARNEHGGLIGGTEKNKNSRQNKLDKPFEVPNDKAQNGSNDKPKSPEEHQKAYQDYFDKQKEGYMNNNGMTEKDASKIAKKDADEKFGNRNPAYHDSIKEQCQNDLGMSEEDANKVADYMTEANFNPDFDNSKGIPDDISSAVGNCVDYDTATKSEDKGGLGYSQDEALDMKDYSTKLGTDYMALMNRKATQTSNKASFDSVGSRAATAEARNARSEALGGSNMSNDINRSSRAAHGAGVSSIFAPKIAKQMRSAREAGYNKVMYKNSDDYAQKRQSKGKSTKVPKRYSYDEELERLNQEDDES